MNIALQTLGWHHRSNIGHFMYFNSVILLSYLKKWLLLTPIALDVWGLNHSCYLNKDTVVSEMYFSFLVNYPFIAIISTSVSLWWQNTDHNYSYWSAYKMYSPLSTCMRVQSKHRAATMIIFIPAFFSLNKDSSEMWNIV